MTRRRSTSRASRPLEPTAELDRLCEQLSDLARRLFLAKPHARDVVRSLPPLDLELRVDFSGHANGGREQARRLIHELDAHIDDAILSHAAFRPGTVYCFFCERADCEHASPCDPRHVFRGYGETGTPRWISLLDRAIELGHEGVGELAAERGARIMLEARREELVGQRLPSFARSDRAYDIRGQLALGYYRMDTKAGQEKFAVTIQIIRSATRSRVVRLGVNAIGRLPDGRPARALLGSDARYSYVELLAHTDRYLASVNQELKRRPAKERMEHAAKAADRLLYEMAHGFDRRQRRRSWRTGHAVKRADEKTRPTGMARHDLESARADRVFFDRQEKTYVVLGANGRAHVFTSAGLHVTSLHLDKSSVDGRLAHKRWQPLEAGDVETVLARARAVFATDRKGTED